MAVEREIKFQVTGDGWRRHIRHGEHEKGFHIRQGYVPDIVSDVRVKRMSDGVHIQFGRRNTESQSWEPCAGCDFLVGEHNATDADMDPNQMFGRYSMFDPETGIALRKKNGAIASKDGQKLNVSSVRLRISTNNSTGEVKGFITIKGKRIEELDGKPEFEYQVPHEALLNIFEQVTKGHEVEKTRYYLAMGYQGDPARQPMEWVVDEFGGKNKGLTIIEAELRLPTYDWVGERFTQSNYDLAKANAQGVGR